MHSRTYYILYEAASWFLEDLRKQLNNGYFVLEGQRPPPAHCKVILVFILRDSTSVMVSGQTNKEWNGAGACIVLAPSDRDAWSTFIDRASALAADEFETLPPVISATKPLFRDAQHDNLSSRERSDIFETELTPKPTLEPRRLSQLYLDKDHSLETDPASNEGEGDYVELWEDTEALIDEPPSTEDEYYEQDVMLFDELSVVSKQRLALSGDQQTRESLIGDSDPMVHISVLKNPEITMQEVRDIARMSDVNPEVFFLIASHEEWSQFPSLRLALVKNPAVPLPLALQLVPGLKASQLQELLTGDVKRQIRDAARRALDLVV